MKKVLQWLQVSPWICSKVLQEWVYFPAWLPSITDQWRCHPRFFSDSRSQGGRVVASLYKMVVPAIDSPPLEVVWCSATYYCRAIFARLNVHCSIIDCSQKTSQWTPEASTKGGQWPSDLYSTQKMKPIESATLSMSLNPASIATLTW